MRSHTLTLYNSLGEVERRAAFKRRVFEGRLEYVSESGEERALVIIPDVEGFVPPESFVGDGWTLRDGDLIAVGESAIEVPPSSAADLDAAFEVHRIVGYSASTLFGGRIHHLEVNCA
jgi:hypothetical protein